MLISRPVRSITFLFFVIVIKLLYEIERITKTNVLYFDALVLWSTKTAKNILFFLKNQIIHNFYQAMTESHSWTSTAVVRSFVAFVVNVNNDLCVQIMLVVWKRKIISNFLIITLSARMSQIFTSPETELETIYTNIQYYFKKINIHLYSDLLCHQSE